MLTLPDRYLQPDYSMEFLALAYKYLHFMTLSIHKNPKLITTNLSPGCQRIEQ